MVGIVVMAAGVTLQGQTPSTSADETAIRNCTNTMVEGWNSKSGKLFAKCFATDADYVVINGTHLQGQDKIAEGHQRIFDTIYKDSILGLTIKQIRFLRPDIAVVHILTTNTPKPGAEKSNTIITLVMMKDESDWRIAAFQNTAIAAPSQN